MVGRLPGTSDGLHDSLKLRHGSNLQTSVCRPSFDTILLQPCIKGQGMLYSCYAHIACYVSRSGKNWIHTFVQVSGVPMKHNNTVILQKVLQDESTAQCSGVMVMHVYV